MAYPKAAKSASAATLTDDPVVAADPGSPPVDLSHLSSEDFPEFLGAGRANCVSGIHLNPDWAHPSTPGALETEDRRGLVLLRSRERLCCHDGTTRGKGYGSPTLATLCGVRQVLQVNTTSVTAQNPADGQELWSYPWPGSDPKIPQPIPLDGDRVFLCAGHDVGAVMLQISSGPGGRLTAARTWASRRLKSKYSNNAVRQGFAYGLDEGALTCLDLATGEKRWRGESYGYGQLLLVDDLLLIVPPSGEIVLVSASPDSFHELGRFSALSSTGDSVTNPTLSGHRLLIRNGKEAACFDLR